MFFNHKNCTFKLSGVDLAASNVNLSIETKNTPIYKESDKKNSLSYAQEGFPESSFSVSYYVTGKDFIREYVLGTNSETPISGNFCGLFFESGYITSYSIKGSPNSLAQVDLDLKVFQPLKGDFSPTKQPIRPEISGYNFSKFYLSGVIAETNFDSNTHNFLNFNYQYKRDVQSFVKEGRSSFDVGSGDRVYFGRRNQKLSFQLDNFNVTLPASGVPCSLNISLLSGVNNPIDTLSFSGIVDSKSVSISSPGFAISEFSLTQDYSHSRPAITGFGPGVFPTNYPVRISGVNFINVKNVYFGENLASSFIVNSSALITSVSPAKIRAGEIRVETDEYFALAGSNFIPGLATDGLAKAGFVSPTLPALD